MNNNTGRLVDYYDIGILIEDIDFNRFRGVANRIRIWNCPGYFISRPYSVSGFFQVILNQYIAFMYQRSGKGSGTGREK